MATYTWTGTTNTDWDTATNWSGGTVPLATDTATISGAASSVTSTSGTDKVATVSVDGGAALAIDNQFTVSTALNVGAGTVNLVGATIALVTGGSIINSGAIKILRGSDQSQITVPDAGPSSFTNSGTLTVGQDALLRDYADFANTGTVVVDGGYLGVDAGFHGDGGTVTISNHGHFGIGGLWTNSNIVKFGAGTTNVFDIDTPQNTSVMQGPTIDSMKAGDYISLGEATTTNIGQPTFANGVLTYSDGGKIYSVTLTNYTPGIKFIAIKDQAGVNPGPDPGSSPVGHGVDLIINAPGTFSNVPSTKSVAAGGKFSLGAVSIADGFATTETDMTLTVSDNTGSLSWTTDAGTKTGTSLTLTGTLAKINAALGTLGYTASAAGGLDRISLNYTDGQDTLTAGQTITINPATAPPGNPPPGNPPPSSASQNFAYTDTTTHAAGTSAGTAYSGPVTYVKQQYIWSGNDKCALTANTGSVFMHGGPSDDALTAVSGSNVLDGGSGSNFLVGAPGTDGGFDTFFDDGRGSKVTWDTLVNFHHGDAATIFGFTGGLSTMQWADNEGATGYQGATLHSELGGAGTGINATITFAGLSLADAQAKLTISTGNVDGNAYLYLKYS